MGLRKHTTNKASGGDGIPAKLFQILKDLIVLKCCTQYASKLGKLSSGHRTGKGQFSSKSQRRVMPKNVQITIQLHSYLHARKVVLNVLQARLQQFVNQEFPDVQAGFRKGRRTRDYIVSICWSRQKAREFQKNIYFCFIVYTKPLNVWITTNWKILQEIGIPDHLTCLLRNLYAGQEVTELDMKQWTSSKLGKE